MCGICKKLEAYFKKHVYYNAATHLIIGLGLGILITYPLIKTHPLRFGVAILAIGLLAHLYPLMVEK